MADTSWLDAQSSPVGSTDTSWLDAHSSPIADSAVPEASRGIGDFALGALQTTGAGIVNAIPAAINAGSDIVHRWGGNDSSAPVVGNIVQPGQAAQRLGHGFTNAPHLSIEELRAYQQPGDEKLTDDQLRAKFEQTYNNTSVADEVLPQRDTVAGDLARGALKVGKDAADITGGVAVARSALALPGQAANAARGVRTLVKGDGFDVETPSTVAEPPKAPGGFKAEDLAEKPQATPPTVEKPQVALANAPSTKAALPIPEKSAPANAPKTAPQAEVAPDFKLEFNPPPKEGTTRAALPAESQAANEATLRAIGLKETRNSAITGDTKETGTDFQTSKLDNAAGGRMTTVINNEREALRDYADGLVEDSGGSTGTDQSARQRRGQAITAPIEAYDKALEAQTKQHYQIADQRAAGTPIQLDGVQNFLQKNKSAFLGTTEGKQLFEGVQARAQELGLTGSNETFNPATVEQAERLRQYLNDNWSPRTGRLIGAIKNTLDEDVTRAAGADVYAAGRAVRAARAANLEEPKGVSKLLAPDDKLGINRQVEYPDVGQYVADLSPDQFGQVVNVLKAAGKNAEIAPQSAKALNEIRAHFANELKAKGDSTKGMWNEKAVHQYLADNNANMTQVFTPEEMQRFKTLHDAGSILRMDRSYPGAAAQGHNLVVGGAIKAVEHGGTMGGAALGHIPGAIVGHAAGKAAAKFSDKVLGAAVEKRIRKL